MKKVIVAILMAAMICSLTACGGNNKTGVLGTFKLEPTGDIKVVDLNVEKIRHVIRFRLLAAI